MKIVAQKPKDAGKSGAIQSKSKKQSGKAISPPVKTEPIIKTPDPAIAATKAEVDAILDSVNLEKIQETLGGDFWCVEELLVLAKLPLTSVENCNRICKYSNEGSILWRKAYVMISDLLIKEVEAASTAAEVDSIMERIPIYRETARPTVCGVVINKRVTFENSFEGILAVVDRAYSSRLCGYDSYTQATLDRMRQFATKAVHWAWLYKKEGKDSLNAEATLRLVKTTFLQDIKAKKIRRNRAEQEKILKEMPDVCVAELFAVLIKETEWTEDELRTYLKDHREYNTLLNAVATRAIDEIVLADVKKIRAYNQKALKAIRQRVCGLQKSALLWEVKMDNTVQKKLEEGVKSFDEILQLYDDAQGASLKRHIWDLLKHQAVRVETAEKLWRKATGFGNPELSNRAGEVADLWLHWASDDLVEIRKIYGATHSKASYERLVAASADLNDAITIWQAAHRRGSDSDGEKMWEAGLNGTLRHIQTVCDAIDVMSQISDRDKRNGANIPVIARGLEVVKDTDEMGRLIRAIKEPGQEIRIMLVNRLADFYPAEAVGAGSDANGSVTGSNSGNGANGQSVA